MPDSTRRNFLLATGAGAAAVGVAAALPGSAAAKPAAESPTLPSGAQPLVAHIADPRSGSLTLLVGDREVSVHDPELVARLARAAEEREA